MHNKCPVEWMKFFKAACDQQRQAILTLIKKHKTMNATEIVEKMHITQPTVSHHLKILHEASLIHAVKKGKEVYYSLNKSHITDCCTGFMENLTHGKSS